MGCSDPPSRGVGAPHQCPLGSVASYLIYADVRLHIPMTHHNDRLTHLLLFRHKESIDVYAIHTGKQTPVSMLELSLHFLHVFFSIVGPVSPSITKQLIAAQTYIFAPPPHLSLSPSLPLSLSLLNFRGAHARD